MVEVASRSWACSWAAFSDAAAARASFSDFASCTLARARFWLIVTFSSLARFRLSLACRVSDSRLPIVRLASANSALACSRSAFACDNKMVPTIEAASATAKQAAALVTRTRCRLIHRRARTVLGSGHARTGSSASQRSISSARSRAVA